MRVRDDRILETKLGSGRRPGPAGNEVVEMHLFDAEGPKEKAPCGGDSSTVERMSVGFYL